MTVTIAQKFDLSNPIQYATFRYYEDIAKLIGEANQQEDTIISFEPDVFGSGYYKLKEIKWDRFYDDCGKTKYVILKTIYETD